MGLRIQRRIKINKNTHVNVSNSGVSTSVKIGRLTLNSRGRSSIRLFKGLSLKF